MASVIEKRVALLFFLLLLVAAGAQLGLRVLAERSTLLAEQVAERREGVAEVQATLLSLEDAETGQRGFIITGDESYLDAYHAGVSSAPQRLGRVADHVARTRVASEADIKTLRTLVDEKLADLKYTIELRRKQGFEAASKAVGTRRGKQLMDRIRQVIGRIVTDEQAQLQANIAEYRAVRRWVWPGAIFVALIQVALLVMALVVLNRHSTRRRASEQSLKKLVDELEQARRGAESASRAKSAFLANMSHELRTPLTSIIGFAEMLAEDAAAEGEKAIATDARQILSSARRLMVLVNDLLDISKIEAGRITRIDEDVSVEQLARDIVRNATAMVERNNNTFEVQVAPNVGWARFDAGKARQIIENMLSNAAKFTSDGIVRLQVSREPSQLSVRVIDSGIGIDAEQLKTLFQPFAQADNTIARRFGGTGLGLAISRSLARHLGGDLTVTSTFGEGSTFTLTLPVVDLPPTQRHGVDGVPASNELRQLSPK